MARPLRSIRSTTISRSSRARGSDRLRCTRRVHRRGGLFTVTNRKLPVTPTGAVLGLVVGQGDARSVSRKENPTSYARVRSPRTHAAGSGSPQAGASIRPRCATLGLCMLEWARPRITSDRLAVLHLPLCLPKPGRATERRAERSGSSERSVHNQGSPTGKTPLPANDLSITGRSRWTIITRGRGACTGGEISFSRAFRRSRAHSLHSDSQAIGVRPCAILRIQSHLERLIGRHREAGNEPHANGQVRSCQDGDAGYEDGRHEDGRDADA